LALPPPPSQNPKYATGRAPQLQVRTAVAYGNFDHITMALMPYVNIKVTEKKTNNLKFHVLIRLARLFFTSANLSNTELTYPKVLN